MRAKVCGGVSIVLRLLGDRAVAGGDKGAVHEEHGVLGESRAWLKRELRAEVVDDPVGRRLGDAEPRGELTHRLRQDRIRARWTVGTAA